MCRKYSTHFIFHFRGKYQMEEEKGRPQFYNKLMKLHIHNITREDFGKYKCLAKNSQGETSGEIELNGKWLRSKYPIWMIHKILQPRPCDYITHLVLEHVWSSCITCTCKYGYYFSSIVSINVASFYHIVLMEICKAPNYKYCK